MFLKFKSPQPTKPLLLAAIGAAIFVLGIVWGNINTIFLLNGIAAYLIITFFAAKKLYRFKKVYGYYGIVGVATIILCLVAVLILFIVWRVYAAIKRNA